MLVKLIWLLWTRPSNCNVTPGKLLEVCSSSGADCGPRGPNCSRAMQFLIEPLHGGAAMRIRSSLDPGLCLTAAPFPHDEAMNITLQVWARPLASGAVAAVAFNRGSFPARLNLTWAMIGVKSRRGAVRDLWRHQDMGSFMGGYEVLVEPHKPLAASTKDGALYTPALEAQRHNAGQLVRRCTRLTSLYY